MKNSYAPFGLMPPRVVRSLKARARNARETDAFNRRKAVRAEHQSQQTLSRAQAAETKAKTRLVAAETALTSFTSTRGPDKVKSVKLRNTLTQLKNRVDNASKDVKTQSLSVLRLMRAQNRNKKQSN